MFHLWLPQIAALIAGSTDPDTPARLGEATAAAVIANRIAYDHYEHETDAIDAMPYFVLADATAVWQEVSVYDLEAHGVVEMTFFERAEQYHELSSLNARHAASKLYYLTFVESLVQSIAQRQNRSPSLVPVRRIELVGLAYRTPIDKRDLDDPRRDYWQSTWHLQIGQ